MRTLIGMGLTAAARRLLSILWLTTICKYIVLRMFQIYVMLSSFFLILLGIHCSSGSEGTPIISYFDDCLWLS